MSRHTKAGTFSDLANSFDLIISTVPVSVDLDAYLGLLARDGILVNLSLPQKPLSISAVSLFNNRRSIAGTRSGGLRLLAGDVRFRFVIDISTMTRG